MAYDTKYTIEVSTVELRMLFQLLLDKNNECEVMVKAGDERNETRIEHLLSNLLGLKVMQAMLSEELFEEHHEWLSETLAEGVREGYFTEDGMVKPIEAIAILD